MNTDDIELWKKDFFSLVSEVHQQRKINSTK